MQHHARAPPGASILVNDGLVLNVDNLHDLGRAKSAPGRSNSSVLRFSVLEAVISRHLPRAPRGHGARSELFLGRGASIGGVAEVLAVESAAGHLLEPGGAPLPEHLTWDVVESCERGPGPTPRRHVRRVGPFWLSFALGRGPEGSTMSCRAIDLAPNVKKRAGYLGTAAILPGHPQGKPDQTSHIGAADPIDPVSYGC